MKRYNKDKLIAAGIALSFAGIVYLKNRFMPKYADDYPYSFVWEGDEHGNLAIGNHRFRRVRSFKDLLKSQISHYMTWDGRTIAESLVQLFLMPDKKKYFDLANTAVLLSQLAICAGLGSGKKPGRLAPHKKALLLGTGFWACAPHLAASCFWLTGSMNYMWVGALQSSYVLQYSRKFHDPSYRIPAPLAAFLGLLAGWSTETGAGAALMLSAMELLYARLRGESEKWMVSGIAGCVAGMILLLAAPGNRVKLKTEAEFSETLPTDVDDRSPGYVPVDQLYTPYMFKAYFKEGFLPTAIRELPLHLPVIVYLLNSSCRTRQADLYIAALESAAWAVPTVMMLSPEYPLRACYPSVIYLLGAAVYALSRTGTEVFPYDTGWFKALLALSGIAFAGSLVASMLVDADFYRQMSDQLDTLRKSREGIPTLDPVMPPPVYSFLAGDRSIDLENCMGLGGEEYWDPYNEAVAAYYGTGDFAVDFELDHPYEEKGLKGIIRQLVTPVKSFARRIRQIIRGQETA